MQSQMLKGVIEGVILAIIKDRETYGYEIVEKLRINGFYNMTESTVYPILNRLKKRGYILGTFRKSSVGPKRKYYFITDKGKKFLEEFERDFKALEKAVNTVLKSENI